MQIRMPFQRLGRNTYTIGGKGKTLRQMHVEYATMTGVLKAEMGVVYPFQWYGCLDIIDKVKATKYFKQGVKKGLNGYISEMKIKRAQLLYPPHGSTRMFHVGDFNKSTLMKFREGITDEEYYDLWENQGLVAHAKNKTLINSLIWVLQKGVADPFIFFYTICGILIVFSTWIVSRRKAEFKISPVVTILYLVLITLISSLCTIISSGILDYFHYIYYDVPDMMNPIKSFTESFVNHHFSLLVSCILAQIPISFADRLIATFAGYGVYRLCERFIERR